MPYARYNANGLKTMGEAAKMNDIPKSTFWKLVRSHRLLPEPTIRQGGRFYCSISEMESLAKIVKAFRAAGMLGHSLQCNE